MLKRAGVLSKRLGSPAAAIRTPWERLQHGQRGVLQSGAPASKKNSVPPPVSDTLAAKLARVEAILFLSREPLPSRKLAALADLADGTEARSLVRELGRRMRRRGSGFQPVEVAHGVQLLTRPPLADW